MNNDSLSVILPIHDRQDQILLQIEQLLDDLANLSNQIELILVDDGSKDTTPELLEDCRRQFPQIRVQRNPVQVGAGAAAQSAIQSAKGDLVFVHESYDPINIEQLKQLWQFRLDQQLVVARATTRSNRIDHALLQRLSEWGQRLETNMMDENHMTQGLQMIRRQALQALSSDQRPAGNVEVSHVSHQRVSGPKFAEKITSKQVSKQWP